MKRNAQKIEKIRSLLTKALDGVDSYLNDWEKAPQNFTTKAELTAFSKKLREMKESLDNNKVEFVVGLWRIMETWPYKNEVRQKVVEAELAYEREICGTPTAHP